MNTICDYAERKRILVTMEDFDDIRALFSGSDELLWFLEQVPKLAMNEIRLFPSPAGFGIIPLEEILTRLKADGYDDTLAIEHFDAVDQLGYMEQSAEWVRSSWAKKLV